MKKNIRLLSCFLALLLLVNTTVYPVAAEEAVVEETPVVEEVVTEETPAVEESAGEETPATEKESATEESTETVEEPAGEETPATEKEPATEESTETVEEPAAEETPATAGEPAAEESPAAAEEPATEGDAAVAEDTEPVDRAPESAELFTIGKEYSYNVQSDEVLWFKVNVAPIVSTNTHIKIETEGVDTVISAFYSLENAMKGVTETEYFGAESPLYYPLAWLGSDYYIKVQAQESGMLGLNGTAEALEPELPEYKDSFCSSEALAMYEPTIKSLLGGMRTIRDDCLKATEYGTELVDYYYGISGKVYFETVTDVEFRQEVIEDAKELIPLIKNIVAIYDGTGESEEAGSYEITAEDYQAAMSIKDRVLEKLNGEDRILGAKLWEEMRLDEYVGKELSEFLDSMKNSSARAVIPNNGYSEYIVYYSGQEDVSSLIERANSLLESNGIDVVLNARESENLFGDSRKYIIEVLGCSNEELIQQALAGGGIFDKVDVNYRLQLASSDVNYEYEWYLENVGQKIPTRKSDKTKYVAGKKGADISYVKMRDYLKDKSLSKVVVAVIDTGINYNLADFDGRVDLEHAYNFVSDKADPLDDNDHGTHVSGIIAANAENNYSMAGVNPGAIILPIKVLDSEGSGNADNLAKAVKHAADSGANVINMSLGMRKSNGDAVLPSDCEEVELAFQYAIAKNVTIICAAGNESKKNLSYPANSAYTISVGAIDNKNKLASFTNTGKGLHLVAPGVSIPSLVKNGEVMFFSGTSMASPVVVGVASLLYALDPGMTPEKVRSILTGTAKDLGKKGYDTKYGYGCVNAFKAVKSLETGGTGFKTIKVKLNANGGRVTPASIQVNPVGTYGSLPVPTRNGYTFTGWYTTKKGSKEVRSDTAVIKSKSHTLYAHWTKQ